MEIRAYRPEDCPIIAQLFYDTVHCVTIPRLSWTLGLTASRILPPGTSLFCPTIL